MRARTDPALKARALELAEREGAAAASRATGIPAATIRAWRSRGEPAVARPADGPSADAELERTLATIESAQVTAREAIDRIRQVVPHAKSPQSLAISAGVLLDKALQLEAAVATRQERHVDLSKQQAELLTEVIKVYFSSLGLSPSSALIADLLRRAGHVVPLRADEGLAVAARAELHRAMRAEWEPRLRREIREQLEGEILSRPALPAAGPDVPAGEVVEEVVTGEVVDAEVRPAPRPGCSHRWRREPSGTYCVLCAGWA